MPVQLADLLQRSDVWQGNQLAAPEGGVVSSGFALLDAQLPGGGWPRGVLIELLVASPGGGEVSFLLPALRQLDATAPFAVVAPPAKVHAPAWASHFPLRQLLQVDAKGEEAPWCVELLLGCGALGAVLAWLPSNLGAKALRRLQLAVEGRRTLAFMFRPLSCARNASPAPYRLAVRGSRVGLQVEILKRRGPPCEQTLVLPVERPVPWGRLAPHESSPYPRSGTKAHLTVVSK